MLNASPAPGSEAVSSPVDLEMLCESLVYQGVKLASEFSGYAVDAVHCLQLRYAEVEDVEDYLLKATSRLWRWLQRNLRREADVAKVELLPLPQPAAFPLKLQHMDFIADRFDDVKTQLQLIHTVVDDLHEKDQKTDMQLGRLQEQLKRVSTCHCQSQERYAPSIAAPTTKKTPTSKTKVSEHRKVSVSTPTLQVDRLEVPMEIIHAPTGLQEHSSAMLYWIMKAMGDGSPTSLSELQIPLHGIRIETPPTNATPTTAQEFLESAQDSVEQPPAMDIQIYQVLARDDPL